MKEQELQNGRIKWIDIAKGIAIICVIIGHTVSNPIRSIIFSFHMPLFFIISGYTIKKEVSFKKAIKKDFDRLIIPVFICLTLNTVLMSMLYYIPLKDSILTSINSLVWGNGNEYEISLFGRTFTFYGIGEIWFLICLFYSKQLYRIILNVVKKGRTFFCFYLSLIGIIIGYVIRLPQCLDIILVVMTFMDFGNILKSREINQKFSKNITFFSTLVWLYFALIKEESLEIATRKYPLFILDIGVSLLASYSIINFSKMLEKFNFSKILIWLGNHSLELLCVHYFDCYYYTFYNFNSEILSTVIRCLIDIIVLYIFINVRKNIKTILKEKHICTFD